MKTLARLLLIGATLSVALASEPRTWTDTQGRTIEATFVKADETAVTVSRDGKETTIPLSMLSKVDLAWVHTEVTAIDAKLYVIQVVKDGVIASGGGKQAGAHVYLPKRVFVQCNTEGLVDDQALSLRIYRDGVYQFETVLGAASTIPRYSTKPPSQKAE